jgi:hypothetical protein
MQKGLKLNGQTRRLAIALGGAAVTSIVAMLVPTSVWEAITGATGISEMIPATAAPLGDTARAIIAFLAGAIAFAVIAGILSRTSGEISPVPAVKTRFAVADTAEANTDTSFVAKMRARLSQFVESRRNGSAVTELSDLPKLRPSDAHPDAPARQPISAHRDFAPVPEEEAPMSFAEELAASVAHQAPVTAPESVQPAPAPAPAPAPVMQAAPVAEPVWVAPVAQAPAAVQVPAATVTEASVAAMLSQLEAAVAARDEQLAKLEALAQAQIAKPVEMVADVQPEVVQAEIVEPQAEPVPAAVQPMRQPILEAVPSEPAKAKAPDDMDAALRSALETLHRMNARTR